MQKVDRMRARWTGKVDDAGKGAVCGPLGARILYTLVRLVLSSLFNTNRDVKVFLSLSALLEVYVDSCAVYVPTVRVNMYIIVGRAFVSYLI